MEVSQPQTSITLDHSIVLFFSISKLPLKALAYTFEKLLNLLLFNVVADMR